MQQLPVILQMMVAILGLYHLNMVKQTIIELRSLMPAIPLFMITVIVILV